MLNNWLYRFEHWAMRWVMDEDGDIGIQFLGIITFIKYKEHTIVHWFRTYGSAEKYQGHYVRPRYIPEADDELVLTSH